METIKATKPNHKHTPIELLYLLLYWGLNLKALDHMPRWILFMIDKIDPFCDIFPLSGLDCFLQPLQCINYEGFEMEVEHVLVKSIPLQCYSIT